MTSGSGNRKYRRGVSAWFTGTEYATMYSSNSRFIQEFGAMIRAMRPSGRDGGSGPSSSTPQQ